MKIRIYPVNAPVIVQCGSVFENEILSGVWVEFRTVRRWLKSLESIWPEYLVSTMAEYQDCVEWTRKGFSTEEESINMEFG